MQWPPRRLTAGRPLGEALTTAGRVELVGAARGDQRGRRCTTGIRGDRDRTADGRAVRDAIPRGPGGDAKRAGEGGKERASSPRGGGGAGEAAPEGLGALQGRKIPNVSKVAAPA